jgi:phosphoglycerate dehydrogenase-like enzyme
MIEPRPRFRILLFEPIHEAGARLLRERGEVRLAPALDEDSLVAAVGDADAIVVRNAGRVSRRVIAAAPRLKVIGRHGVGLDTIDLAAAAERGIRVVYTPEANRESVAEHFVAMALVLSKRLLEADRALREGRWEVRYQYFGRELYGKTLGVVGFGRVGRSIARICRHGFAMPVLYHGRSPAPPELEAEFGARRTGLEELLAGSDYVALTLPLTEATRHCIGRDQIGLMRPSAYLINLGRGPLWDEAAVLEALDQGRLAGAGTDVYETEPAPRDHPLFRHDRFVGTPHMSAHTEEAMRRMSLVAEDVIAVLEGREPRWPVI